jgi:hypothetical protein
MAEQEEKGIESYALRCRRNPAVHGQMTEELFQVLLVHQPRLLESQVGSEPL